MKTRREQKTAAKHAMVGKTATVILAYVTVQALGMISSMLASAVFPGTETLDILLGYLFNFILTLVVSVVNAGLAYMYLNIARGKQYSLSDLFYFFKQHPDHVITASLAFAVINLVTMIPYTLYGYLAPVEYTLQGQIDWLYKSLLLMLAGILVYQLLVIPLEMSYYILSDHPDMKGTDALKESVRMMRGHCGKYLVLKLSYIPLMLLSVFTLYLALLWILPYMLMAETMFYRDLMGEFDTEAKEKDRTQTSNASSESFKEAVKETSEDCAQHPEEKETKEQPKQQCWQSSPQETKGSKTDEAEEEDNEPKPWDDYFNSLK